MVKENLEMWLYATPETVKPFGVAIGVVGEGSVCLWLGDKDSCEGYARLMADVTGIPYIGLRKVEESW